ncbi:cytochrome P450 [Mycobacterium sp. CPCC 205372]|uniref:Cytochrome P450 n=1 Tax=Mycobacterium hippophais TaxID=3016340 RepID=A0ABT4PS27_9MYCO|nr:cytochrome P450 [Mycobacterium hippophais]MCZ8379367.1 cytochrome P450 [Mycobacterium hippophais]
MTAPDRNPRRRCPASAADRESPAPPDLASRPEHWCHRPPPVARGLPWLGVAHRISRDKFDFAPEIARRYGDLVRLPVPGKRAVYLITSAELVGQVFVRRAGEHCKGAMLNAAMAPVPGTPIPVMEGIQWRRIRRLTTPFFSVAGLKAVLVTMDDVLDTHVDRLAFYAQGGTTVDMEQMVSHASIDVMLRTILNRALPEKQYRRIARHFRSASEGAATRWAWFWLPAPLRYLLSFPKDARATPLMALMYLLVRHTDTGDAGGDDLFAVLRRATSDDGSTLTERQLVAHMFTFVFAGFETTAAALAWTFALLAVHPEAMIKAQNEAASLGRTPRHEDVDRLPYLRACFDEAQRMQGLPYYSRDSIADQVLGGYFVPAGSVLLCSPYAMQHDPRYWRQPELFRPERWFEDPIERNAYLPFGIGERRCIGANMANVEGVLYLAKALYRFTFRVPDDWRPQRHFHMSTSVRGGVPTTIGHHRKATAPSMKERL